MKNLASKNYEILEHPADLKIKVWGKNLEEILNNILLAIKEGTRPELLKEEIVTPFKIEGENFENLIFNFLAELVYQMDLNDSFYEKVKIKKSTEKKLEGEIFGQKVKRFTTEIKGVTWYEFSFKKEKDKFILIVVFDV